MYIYICDLYKYDIYKNINIYYDIYIYISVVYIYICEKMKNYIYIYDIM